MATVLSMADVAGKGVPAALLMANLQAALRPLMRDGTAPAEACRRLNHHAHSSGKFISFFHALLDANHRTLRYANAGHVAPLVVRTDGSWERLDAGGAVLGHFDDWDYGQAEVRLNPGDRLLLFTDGLVEAANAAGEEFGEERFVKTVAHFGGTFTLRVLHR